MGRLVLVRLFLLGVVSVQVITFTFFNHEVPSYDASGSGYLDILWTLGIGSNANLRSDTESDSSYPFPRSKWLEELMNDTIEVSNGSVRFWYPSSLVGINATLVTGVTSNAYAKKRRDAIRETWGLDYLGRRGSVFFVVAKENGRWPVEEAVVHGDMILVDDFLPISNTNGTGMLSFKSHVWLYAAHKYAASFDFVLKTEDDSFVDIEGLTEELEFSSSMVAAQSQQNSIYWGRCSEKYCDDSGYVLSRNALYCMLGKGPLSELAEGSGEARAIGFLANKCGIKPTVYHSKLVFDGNSYHVSQSGAVFHYVRLIYSNMPIQRMYQYDLMYKLGGKKWKPGSDISRFRAGYFENYEKENEIYFAKMAALSAPTEISKKPSQFPIPLGETSRMIPSQVMISGRRISFWYPSTLEQANNIIVIGVLSGPGNFARRDDVRKTWGKNFNGRNENNIFFLVAKENGKWPIEEATVFSDLILLDIEEAYNNISYSSLPFKSQVWLHLVNTRVSHAEFLLKTDDDAFVDVDGLTRQLQSYKQYLKSEGKTDLYWGNCLPKNHQIVIRDKSSKWYVSEKMFSRKFYPPYCIGGGYVLSKGPGLDCMVNRLNQISHLTLEDAATGLLAEMCNVQPLGYFNEMVTDITSAAGLKYMRLVYHKLGSDKLWQFNALYKQGRKRWRVRNKIRRFRDGILEKYIELRV